MSTTTLNAKFKLRRDTLENWTTNNPTIAAGEPILVYDGDDTKIKIGKGPNGSTFNNTEYYGGDWDSLLNKPFYTERIESHFCTADYNAPSTLLVEDQEQILYSRDDTGSVVGVPFKVVRFRNVPAYTAEQLKSLTISCGWFQGNQPVDEHNDIQVTDDLLVQTEDTVIIRYPDQTFPVFFSVFEGGGNVMGLSIADAGFYGIYLDLGEIISKGINFNQPEFEVIHKLDPKYIDKSQLNFSWTDLTDRPFGDMRYPSFSVQGITEYEDLISSSQAPSFDESANMPQNNGIYRLGDYIPFTYFENSTIAVTIKMHCEYQNEEPADGSLSLDLLASNFENEENGSYKLKLNDIGNGNVLLIGVPTDDYVEEENETILWAPEQAGIYIICYEESFTTDPISEEEKVGTVHYWVSGIMTVGNSYTKLIDQKYLPDISYSQLNDTLVSSLYYNINHQETFNFSSYTEASILINNSNYYYSLYNNDINLSEDELFTSLFSNYNNSSNNFSLPWVNSSECIVDKIYGQHADNATIYYIYSNIEQKDYADIIYIKTDFKEGSSIFCSLYDKNDNIINQNNISSDKLYLLRWPDENDNSITYGVTSMQTGYNGGNIAKKLHPRFLPSYLSNREDNKVCKWIDSNTIFTPNTEYSDSYDLTRHNYYTIIKSSQCRTGISDNHIIVSTKDAPGDGIYAQIRFYITANESDTLCISSDNYTTVNNYGRIAISNLDTSLDYQDLSDAYITGDYDTVFSGSPPSFNITKGKHFIDVVIWSTNYDENDTDYIDLYLDTTTSKTLSYVTTLSDYLNDNNNNNNLTVENIPNLPASKITSGTFDQNLLPDIFYDYDYNMSDIDLRKNYLILTMNNIHNKYNFLFKCSNVSTLYNNQGNFKLSLESYNRTITILEDNFENIGQGIYLYIDREISNYPLFIYCPYLQNFSTFDTTSTELNESINLKNGRLYEEGNTSSIQSGVYVLDQFTWYNICKRNKYHGSHFSWDSNISDKPFGYYNNTVYYSGSNITGSASQLTLNNITNNYYKIGNSISKKELTTCIYSFDNGQTERKISYCDVEEALVDNIKYYQVTDPFDSSSLPFMLLITQPITINGTNFTEGLWIKEDNTNYNYLNCTLSYLTPNIQTIDENYIPDSVRYQLPPATPGNEGAVLRMVSGVWTAVQLPSASGQSF